MTRSPHLTRQYRANEPPPRGSAVPAPALALRPATSVHPGPSRPLPAPARRQGAYVRLAIGARPRALASVALNGDSLPDLMVAGKASGTVSVLLAPGRDGLRDP